MTLEDLAGQIAALERKIDQMRGVKTGAPLGALTERVGFTFISPCYNEAENLRSLHQRITETCRQYGVEDYEILWVENGSADDSISIMEELHRQDPHLRVFQLSRNFGYQGAIACGLMQARGEWVGTLDADLQDPPELLMEMLQVAREGRYEVVYGVRRSRAEGIFLRAAYRLFYRVWKMTADIHVPLDAGDFGVMHRQVIDAINLLPERQRFVRGLRAWAGFRQCGFPYDRKARFAGRTKFNLRGMVVLALDGIVSYSVVPLRLNGLIGLLIVGAALTLSGVQAAFRLLAYAGIVENPFILPPGLTQVNLILVALFGLNIITIGIIGEYVGRIYNESKDRPPCIIRRTLP